MAEAEERKATEINDTDQKEPMPSSLKTGIWGLAIAVVCVAGAIITGFPTCCLFGLVTGIVLPLAGIAVALGLFQKANRRRPRLWHNLATLTAIIALLYLLTFGPCGGVGLLNLRMRGLVALTGGQEELQSWAVELLAQPRDPTHQDGSGWHIPHEECSKQVQRLKPNNIFIGQFFQNDREGVRLMYGGGFQHWGIVVGPPGSVPDPKISVDRPYDEWFRWGDGIYGWFPDY